MEVTSNAQRIAFSTLAKRRDCWQPTASLPCNREEKPSLQVGHLAGHPALGCKPKCSLPVAHTEERKGHALLPVEGILMKGLGTASSS